MSSLFFWLSTDSLDRLDPAIDAAVEKLSAPQRRAWAVLAVERLVRLLCGRQAGKTHLIALWLLVGALTMAGSVNVYLSLTKESAKRNIWPELRAIGIALGLDESCFKLHGGVVTLPNGSTVLVMGTDDKATIETWRGPKLYRVAVDEMGAQPPEWVQYLVTEILWWTVMRNNGAFLLAGNPGLIPDGYWWDLTKPETTDNGLHSWDVFSNPGIPHAQTFVDETLERFSWTAESPGYIRSVLGRWVVDEAAVVYPYRDERNGVDALPVLGPNDGIIARSEWRYVVAGSVANPEHVAWVVWAWHPAIVGAFAVEAVNEAADPDAAVERLTSALKRHPGARCVVDPGELGEEHVVSLRRRWRLPAIAATKLEKPSAIRDLRGAVMSGSAKVLRGPELRELRDAWKVTAWHPRRPLHDPARPDMLASAAAFGHRRIPPHTPTPYAAPNTKAWQQQVIERMQKQVDAEARGRGRGAIGRLER